MAVKILFPTQWSGTFHKSKYYSSTTQNATAYRFYKHRSRSRFNEDGKEFLPRNFFFYRQYNSIHFETSNREKNKTFKQRDDKAINLGLKMVFKSLTRILTVLLCCASVQCLNDQSVKVGPFQPSKLRPSYDYIVVGGGSAGAVIASRLSEDPSVTVLLLEAGGDNPFYTEIPGAVGLALNSKIDWHYL